MGEPREDAGGLQVPLDAGQIERASEVSGGGHLECGRRGTEAREVGLDERVDQRGRPLDVAIPQDRHEVVGERTAHGVLKIEQTRAGRGAGVAGGPRQIARVIIPMNEYARLREKRLAHELGGRVDGVGVRRGVDTKVAREQPVGEQCEFAVEARVDEVRQVGRIDARLHRHERVDGGAVECRRIVRREDVEVDERAEILEEQETRVEIDRVDRRRGKARAGQAPGDVDEGPTVFVFGRRVHYDERFAERPNAKIPAEARVGRGRREAVVSARQGRPRKPLEGGLAAPVGVPAAGGSPSGHRSGIIATHESNYARTGVSSPLASGPGGAARESDAMLIASLAVVAGLVALTYGADRFVDGAAALASRLGVGQLVVGIIVVGFSTSAPEMLVAAMASFDGSPSLAVGNALGSNITNIALVVGITVLVCPLTVFSRVLYREMPAMFAAVVLASVLMTHGGLGIVDGIVLLAALAGALAVAIWSALHASRSDPLLEGIEEAEVPDLNVPASLGVLVFGLLLLLGGSRALVYGATVIARHFEVPELVIGLTVVAIGTSLPELAASVAGARRGHPELALGNIIGSNIFNALGVLAMPALIAPGPVDAAALVRDMPAMVFLSGLLFVVAFRRHGQARINRRAGVGLLACFVGYQLLLYFGVGNLSPPV